MELDFIYYRIHALVVRAIVQNVQQMAAHNVDLDTILHLHLHVLHNVPSPALHALLKTLILVILVLQAILITNKQINANK